MRAVSFNVVTLLKRPVHAQCANGDDCAWFERSRGVLGAFTCRDRAGCTDPPRHHNLP
jgi:hypothetical protein